MSAERQHQGMYIYIYENMIQHHGSAYIIPCYHPMTIIPAAFFASATAQAERLRGAQVAAGGGAEAIAHLGRLDEIGMVDA